MARVRRLVALLVDLGTRLKKSILQSDFKKFHSAASTFEAGFKPELTWFARSQAFNSWETKTKAENKPVLIITWMEPMLDGADGSVPDTLAYQFLFN